MRDKEQMTSTPDIDLGLQHTLKSEIGCSGTGFCHGVWNVMVFQVEEYIEVFIDQLLDQRWAAASKQFFANFEAT